MTLKIIEERIHRGVAARLAEVGATYDSLEVIVDKFGPIPCRVSYHGLRNLRPEEATEDSGSFAMENVGAGLWQGILAGQKITVPVGKTDDVDLPFVDDPQVVGQWESVDFVSEVADFDPAHPAWPQHALHLKQLVFLENGKTPRTTSTWTRGVLLEHFERIASRYVIQHIDRADYMFLEWRSGDVTIAGMKPKYYVLRRAVRG